MSNIEEIKFIRGDTHRFEFRFVENGEPYMLSAGDIIRLCVFKGRQKVISKPATAADQTDDGTIVVVFRPEDTSKLRAGSYEYERELVTGDGRVLTIPRMPFVIYEDLITPENRGGEQPAPGEPDTRLSAAIVLYDNKGSGLKAENLQQAVDELSSRSPAVISAANGDSIVLNDSTDAPVEWLKIYGKTTQSDTPTPTNPLPPVNAGDDGDITVSVSNGTETQTLTVSTPNGLPGVPVRSGGNYTDGNGQQWVCDEIDFERGVYMQRVHRDVVSSGSFITLYAGIAYFWGIQYDEGAYVKRDISLVSNRFVVSSVATPSAVGTALVKTVADNGWSGKARILLYLPAEVTTDAEARAWVDNNEVQIYYPLPGPAETPLSADEIAACKALRTGYPVTSLLNDSGAGMAVSYVADTKNYIDNKFAALEAAILSTGGNV